ncbi:hypothetical protein M441DRAFT_438684, partial [Trichoderma asperellum CBS 433.97]
MPIEREIYLAGARCQDEQHSVAMLISLVYITQNPSCSASLPEESRGHASSSKKMRSRPPAEAVSIFLLRPIGQRLDRKFFFFFFFFLW